MFLPGGKLSAHVPRVAVQALPIAMETTDESRGTKSSGSKVYELLF